MLHAAGRASRQALKLLGLQYIARGRHSRDSHNLQDYDFEVIYADWRHRTGAPWSGPTLSPACWLSGSSASGQKDDGPSWAEPNAMKELLRGVSLPGSFPTLTRVWRASSLKPLDLGSISAFFASRGSFATFCGHHFGANRRV